MSPLTVRVRSAWSHTLKIRHSTFAALFLLISGCSDLGVNGVFLPPVGTPLTSSVNGTELTCLHNQRFSLELDLSADAGYHWDHSISDPSVLILDSTAYRPRSGNWNQVGGITVETFYFRAAGPGMCTVELSQRRRWEPNVPPIQTVRFFVFVYP
jgi:predicted secreted protein